MRRNSKHIFVILSVVLCLLFSQAVIPAYAADEDGNLEYLQSVMDMIKEKYGGDITDEKLVEGALRGMFDTMDPYTVFYDTEEANSFLSDMNGAYEGIGIGIEQKGDYIVVTKVFPSSPAEKSELYSGDKIVSVDGKSILGVSAEEAAALIKGESGTKVVLGVLHSGETGVVNIEVTRGEVKINPVSYDIRGDIGYIKIETFNANTYECMAAALQEMDKNGITKIILDLRDNPGGEVSQTVAVARSFVPEGLITRLDFKSEDDTDQEYYSYLKNPKYRLAVLVNGMSASASEIFAGAVQDTGAGTLIGTKTFGKAKVQSLIPVLTPEAYSKYEEQLGVKLVDAYDLMGEYGITPDDSEIMGWTKITTGFYYTPNGRMIDTVGLTPDIVIDDPEPVDGIDLGSIQKLTVTSKPALNAVGTDVYNAEKILKLLGYDVDTPDMEYDAGTAEAVWKFREDGGFYAGDILDYTTQKALNGKLEELLLKYDKQYEKAVEVLQ